ncbi:hypothetical protein [Massilia antarctica]|uniref:hypothetical protein n=1 Tax=Massilia antarctica TaxID=2765360 RepID=UPI001E4DA480|nr:hypothetical protein [Massilia antarctica]
MPASLFGTALLLARDGMRQHASEPGAGQQACYLGVPLATVPACMAQVGDLARRLMAAQEWIG